jgi:hypothetical protein
VTPARATVLALGLLALAWLGWRSLAPAEAEAAIEAAPAAARPAAPAAVAATAPPAAASARPGPLAPAERQRQLALWQQRLQRASEVLQAYRWATRYPHEARPLTEQPDQIDPQQPIVEDRPLRLPGQPVVPGLFLRTTQDKVHLQGDETVTVSVSAHDGEGRTLPLQVSRALAEEGALGQRSSNWPRVPVAFNDQGTGGDAVAGDGVLSARLQPARQGFVGQAGMIRLSLALQSGEQPGFVYFDVLYSPEVPATWAGAVRERLAEGSLLLELPVQVNTAGRYVVAGRVDDADGRPLALLSFNEELAAGPQVFRLQLFGKLVRDLQPRFPLRLRDVEAFLLKADQFPDRALLPRRLGTVHQTQRYPWASFSAAEWTSEERRRYLAEHERDVRQAQAELDRLLAPVGP